MKITREFGGMRCHIRIFISRCSLFHHRTPLFWSQKSQSFASALSFERPSTLNSNGPIQQNGRGKERQLYFFTIFTLNSTAYGSYRTFKIFDKTTQRQIWNLTQISQLGLVCTTKTYLYTKRYRCANFGNSCRNVETNLRLRCAYQP